MNTLVAVCIGLVAFAEWKDVHISKLIIGSVLVVIGALWWQIHEELQESLNMATIPMKSPQEVEEITVVLCYSSF